MNIKNDLSSNRNIMSAKKVLIILIILKILFFLVSTIKNIWFATHAFSGMDIPYQIIGFQTLVTITNFIFIVLAIAGIVYYASDKNLFNKPIKIFLINTTMVLVISIPRKFSKVSKVIAGDSSFKLNSELNFLLTLAIVTLALYIFSKTKTTTLPVPVSTKTPRFVNFFADNFYLSYLLLKNIGFLLVIYQINSIPLEDAYQSIVGIILIPFAYYFVCEAGFRQTIGKVMTDTYVCTIDGKSPGIFQILGRTILRYIPFEPFSFLTNPMAKWHDRFSGTDVYFKSDKNLYEEDPILDHLITEEDLSA